VCQSDLLVGQAVGVEVDPSAPLHLGLHLDLPLIVHAKAT
jgi:hypothetical protein